MGYITKSEESSRPLSVNHLNKAHHKIPEQTVTVFQYWDGGENSMPEFIHKIYLHNLRLAEHYGFYIILITEANIKRYINNMPDKFFQASKNHQSDICRYLVLQKYGGIWLDSDVIILKDLRIHFQDFLATGKDMCLHTEGRTLRGMRIFHRTGKGKYLQADNRKDYQKVACAAMMSTAGNVTINDCAELLWERCTTIHTISDANWHYFGPTVIITREKKHRSRIWRLDNEMVCNGICFITWVNNPGRDDQSQWLLRSETEAQQKAREVFKESPYTMTWTIYRKHKGSKGNIISEVFDNKHSVFHHLLKLAISEIS